MDDDEMFKGIKGIVDDIDLEDSEIEEINEILDNEIKEIPDNTTNMIMAQIQALLKDKSDINISDIINGSIDEPMLKELQNQIVKNPKLLSKIQDIFFNKML